MKERSLRELICTELSLLDRDPSRSSETYELYKTKLNNIEKERCRGAAIRSKIQNILEGEKCTAFFLGQEKRKQNRAIIEQVENNNGEIITEQEQILETVHKYYEDLFANGISKPEQMAKMLESVDKGINVDDKEWCDTPLSLEEVVQAIEGLNKNKSPGSDGIPAELYQTFKDQLAPLLLQLYNSIELEQATPDSLT